MLWCCYGNPFAVMRSEWSGLLVVSFLHEYRTYNQVSELALNNYGWIIIFYKQLRVSVFVLSARQNIGLSNNKTTSFDY